MAGPLRSIAQGRGVLLVVASPGEAAAVRAGLGASADQSGRARWVAELVAPGIELLETGVGKVNAAAAAVLRTSADRHALVLNLGICGALLPLAELPLGSVVLAERSAYADEGVLTRDRFIGLAEMGFPLGPFDGESISGDSALLDGLRPFADRVGTIAAVSTCSGTDELAREVVRRTGAVAEAMEGAAIAHALSIAHSGVRFAEVRVVSNSTGERVRQRWDLKGSLERLAELTAAIAAD